MTEKQFIKKVKESLKENRCYIEKESLRLFRSGGVDIQRYENNFMLPKIVLTVAYKNLSFQYLPLNKDGEKEVKNLEHF